MEPGRRQTIERMSFRPGERVLEVGVGTGLSLSMYPRTVRVTGIDLSTEMLAQAREKVVEEGLSHVALSEMNAERMAFADGSFDKVVAMYVASTVPNPARLVAEMRRVCRSEDGIFILNHFFSGDSLIGKAEKLVAPLGDYVGWRPDFSLEGFVGETGLDVVHESPAGRFGYWTLLQARRAPAHRERERRAA